ncbi:hypothetical protein [Sphingomonas sp. R86521]|uniref:hypothetical protein n=1 Tax=Sphingomonas sp. R86521 TaxID=3093860 RepID=UPI0036D3E7F6
MTDTVETIAKLMAGIGGLIALFGGAGLLVFGDQLRARDQRAGRIGPAYPTREKQRRQAYMFVGIGAVGVLVITLF